MTTLDSALGGGSLDSIISQMQTNAAEEKKKLEPIEKRETELAEKESKMAPPTPTPSPNMKDYEISPMDSFGSAASWIATFGSLLTRNKLVNALNSGAAVMNTYNNKAANNFKGAYQKWKSDMQAAQDHWEQEQNWVKEQGGINKDNASMISAATKNNTLASMAQAKMMDNYLRDMKKNSSAVTATTAKMEEMDYRVQQDKAKAEKMGVPWTDELDNESHMRHYDEVFNTSAARADKNKKADEELARFDYSTAKPTDVVPGTGMTVATIAQLGEGKYNGKKDAELGLGYGMNPVKKAVDNYVSYKYPNFDVAQAQIDYAGALAAEKKLAVQSKMVELSSNILDASIPSLMNIAEKYQLSESTDINKVYNFINAHASDEDRANFSTQLRAVTTDYATLISRGRSSPTVHSDEEALRILHDDMGINSLKGFAKAAKIEMTNIKQGVDKTTQSGRRKESAPEKVTKTINGKTYYKDENGDWYPQ